MKSKLLHIILYRILLTVCPILFAPAEMMADGIRIIPRTSLVSGDSLRISLEMDLNSVRVGSLTAIYFTPYLDNDGQMLSLPPVVVSGKKREQFEQRGRTLRSGGNILKTTPYLTIPDSRKEISKIVRYDIAIPYAAWMQNASLLLSQEIKDCCKLRLLSLDTLTLDLALNDPCGDRADSTQARPRRVAAVAAPATAVAAAAPLSPAALEMYVPMVSFLKPDLSGLRKQRMQSATLYIDYPLAKYEVHPDYKNNREEINKIDRIIRPLQSDGYSRIEKVSIRGYASPEGSYETNKKLSANRSQFFMQYVKSTYGLGDVHFLVSSVAEDWDGLTELLRKDSAAYREPVLDIIRRYGIFEGRERQLLELQGGVPFQDMLRRLFPKLRRIEVIVDYMIRKVAPEDAAELMYYNPSLLSLEEMYAVARYYRPGTDQYREVYEIAAFHFPDDVIANVNAASAVMLTGDFEAAWNYLRKVENDPRAWNNIGVLTLMQGDRKAAAGWFRKAAGVEPQKARINLKAAEK